MTPRGVVLAAGGTGGHMFPAQALAREMTERGSKVVLVTDRRGAGFGPDLAQVETYHVSAGGVAGGSPSKRVKGLASVAFGYLQAHRLLRRLGADVVVGFGSYASVPTALAGAHAGLRLVLHEQNAVMGRANRLLAPRAQAIATCFERVSRLRAADREKVTLTGNPVRAAIAELGRRPFAVPGGSDALRLLIIGGSQGARVFNDAIPGAVARLPEALRRRLEISQQVPGDASGAVAAAYRRCAVTADLAGFFADMPRRLAAAHLVICRAGASTIAELGAAGRPAIMVPYPFATDDHQTANARALVEAGGGWLLPETSLGPETLVERLESLLATPSLLARAARCAASFSHPGAAQRLADLVCGDSGANGGSNSDGDEPKEAAA